MKEREHVTLQDIAVSSQLPKNVDKADFLLFLFIELSLGPVGQIVCREKDVLVVEKNKLLIPPHWNTYFCWGSYDQTCSFGSYTAEKVCFYSFSRSINKLK